eukprot:350905-Chlamydomonas_euryale.AAC.10
MLSCRTCAPPPRSPHPPVRRLRIKASSMASPAQPAWQHDLSCALKRSSRSPAAKYIQLATVTPAGLPAVRTVVFRGWLWSTQTLAMITDARATKLADIAAQPRAEVAWYLEKTREQFRVRGCVRVVGPGEEDAKLLRARQAVWHNLSDGAKAQMYWPEPGAPVVGGGGGGGGGDSSGDGHGSDGGGGSDHGDEAAAAGEESYVSDNFRLLLLRPDFVDQLRLSRPQKRWLHKLEPADGAPTLPPPHQLAAHDFEVDASAWVTTEVNP